MNRYALIGKSLKHSLSKVIHESFYKEFNILASYDLVELKEEELEAFVNELRKGLYQGINITMPYKKSLIKYLDWISPSAKKINSINTIKVIGSKLYGYNTDYDGFIYMLKEYEINPLNKSCYILGTGGVSNTIYEALKELGAKSIKFVSRNKRDEKTIGYHALAKESLDLVVNATPCGTYPNINDNPLDVALIKNIAEVVDLIYNPKITSLLREAKSQNNGLPMLLYQAYLAEEIWQEKSFAKDDWFKKVGEEIESIW